jgi:hypothetical protein
MLYTRLEIVPFGQWEGRYPIHNIYIANVGGNQAKANYHIWFEQDPTEPGTIRPKPDIIIKGFKRNKGALELLRKALNMWYSKCERGKK